MLDFTMIFKIAGAGVILLVLDTTLKSCGKGDVAAIVDIAGVTILVTAVVLKINDAFNAIRTMFML